MTSRKWGILVISMRVSPWCVWGGVCGVSRAAGALGGRQQCLRSPLSPPPRPTILPLHAQPLPLYHTHSHIIKALHADGRHRERRVVGRIDDDHLGLPRDAGRGEGRGWGRHGGLVCVRPRRRRWGEKKNGRRVCFF